MMKFTPKSSPLLKNWGTQSKGEEIRAEDDHQETPWIQGEEIRGEDSPIEKHDQIQGEKTQLNEDTMQFVSDSDSFCSDFDDLPSVSGQPSIPISTSDIISQSPDMNTSTSIPDKGKASMMSEMEKKAKQKKKEEMLRRSKQLKSFRCPPPPRASIDDLNHTDEQLAEAIQLQEEQDVIQRDKKEVDQKEK
ncbi:hypothetical protein L6452_15773 [Arctium lappa]|uniref:Uncharacterized protein n=1 Tax=Arctium lappa TaxID=4217 RepID=A0ACB9CPU1_ARCLA|nr:hypothetical protein L6452_15773 [Arctium lappa]